MGWMDDAMVELRPWIGQVRIVEDDVGLMAVRRAAGTFALDPDGNEFLLTSSDGHGIDERSLVRLKQGIPDA